MRDQVMSRAIGHALRGLRELRSDFRVVEFSIQRNHVHLIVEADDGKVWGDRYFRVDLTSPRQARHALAYVLQNGAHHGVVAAGVKDPFSSARWSNRYVTRAELPLETSLTSPSRTYLLDVLWEKSWPGAISPAEVPA